MFDEFDNFEFRDGGSVLTPAVQEFTGFGYDPDAYISTAKLAPSAYTSQSLIAGKLGGLVRLVQAVDDTNIGNLNPTIGPGIPNPAYLTYLAVLQAVTTEINGYLSSIYPIPLAQTGTVAIVQVTGLTTDGNNGILSIQIIESGNYLAAPPTAQNPAYLKFIDPLWNAKYYKWALQYPTFQQGTGAQITFAYKTVNYSDESGQILQAYQIDTTVLPIVTAEGKNYCQGDILVLVGGQSFVPAQIQQAMVDLVCHTLYKRRLAPDEKNPFSGLAKTWRNTLNEIKEGNYQLDGTYKRSFSAAQAWTQRSVLFGANSL